MDGIDPFSTVPLFRAWSVQSYRELVSNRMARGCMSHYRGQGLKLPIFADLSHGTRYAPNKEHTNDTSYFRAFMNSDTCRSCSTRWGVIEQLVSHVALGIEDIREMA